MTFRNRVLDRATCGLGMAFMLFGALIGARSQASAQAVPAAINRGSAPVDRVELYGGASYFHPFNSDIANQPYTTVDYGLITNATAYFNQYVGFQVEGSYSPQGPTDNNCIATAQAGPVFRLPKGRFVPFAHFVGGAAKIGGPTGQPCSSWGWGTAGGFGFDIVLPFWHDHLAIRPIQGDMTYSQIDNGPPAGLYHGGTGDIYAYRLSGGFVLRGGDMNPHMDVTLNCSASPERVYPGDPVTLSANALNLGSGKNLSYLWTSPTLKIDGTDATENIDTAGLEPGTYTVAGKLVEGRKQRQLAACTASFTVMDYQPPVISCAADKAAINSGDPVVISSTARSPQNLGLTYTYATSNGQIAPVGNGSTANLTTAGATPGSINVTCTVTDAKGKTATANATVVVATPPPPPPAPQARALCSVSFERDKSRPTRVDNEAKACLDDIALTLGREADAKLLIVGSHDTNELPQDAAARTLNVSDYLTKEKGIDPARLDLRVGDQTGRMVSNTIVPAGATLDPGTAASFDSSKIKRRGQPYGMPGAANKKAVVHRVHRRKKTPAKPKPAPSILNP